MKWKYENGNWTVGMDILPFTQEETDEKPLSKREIVSAMGWPANTEITIQPEPTMIVPDGIAQDLQLMKNYIEEHGWCQGAMEIPIPSGRVCLLGASRKVLNPGGVQNYLIDYIRVTCSACRDEVCVGNTIFWHNDRHAKSEIEILNLLSGAIEARMKQ